MEHLKYPNESGEYRAARNALLDEEIALRAQIEEVAAKRRALPPGGEVPQGKDRDETIFNVFRKANGKIRYFWGSEMAFAPPAPKQQHRAGDLVDPLRGLLDMTPEGRGDFFPKVIYD